MSPIEQLENQNLRMKTILLEIRKVIHWEGWSELERIFHSKEMKDFLDLCQKEIEENKCKSHGILDFGLER